MKRLRPGRRQLAGALALLFLALAVPSAVLIAQAQRQIRWESFHQYRLLADELAARIDGELNRAIGAEEARTGGDYRFLVVAGEAANATALQRSPLARYPVESPVPGALGYFQVDADGTFSTPLLPDGALPAAPADVAASEWAARHALRDRLLEVLTQNALLAREAAQAARAPIVAPAENASSFASEVGALADAVSAAPAPEGKGERALATQNAFDELNAVQGRGNESQRQKLARVEELDLDTTYQSAHREQQQEFAQSSLAQAKDNVQRGKRKEQSAVLEKSIASGDVAEPARVRIFESEVDPFEFTLLDSGHGVLYRTVWRDSRRTIQGVVLDQARFLDGALAGPFRSSPLAAVSDLVIAYRGDVLASVGATDVATSTADAVATSVAPTNAPKGELLHQVRLSAPLGDVQLLWTVRDLPPGPGARIVAWSSLVLFGVLVVGFLALYRLGRHQLALAEQQQDFVSAVSHELKTPLTSIRMYAEMLLEGWASAEKQREYYGFIHDESERLSRLIANVLQLARLERSELELDVKPVAAATLMDTLRSKLSSQVERAGFAATFAVEAGAEGRAAHVDLDALVQIVINLVDNALKFSAKAERKAVDVTLRPRGAAGLELSVRDYGPGIPKEEMRRIFELFYRTGSELTRETVGTGIGLALVRQLAQAMGGEVDVVSREPGAEFVVVLPGATTSG